MSQYTHNQSIRVKNLSITNKDIRIKQQLTHNIETLKQEVQNLSIDKHNLRNAVKSHKAKIETLNTQIVVLADQKSVYQKKIRALEHTSKKDEDTKKELETALRISGLELEKALKINEATARAENAKKLGMDLRHAKQKLEIEELKEVRLKNTQLESFVTSLKAKFTEADDSHRAAKANLATIRHQNQELRTRVEVADTLHAKELDQLQKREIELLTSIEALAKQKDDAELSRYAKAMECESLEKAREEMVKRERLADDRARELERDKIELEGALRVTSQDFQNAMIRMAEFESWKNLEVEVIQRAKLGTENSLIHNLEEMKVANNALQISLQTVEWASSKALESQQDCSHHKGDFVEQVNLPFNIRLNLFVLTVLITQELNRLEIGDGVKDDEMKSNTSREEIAAPEQTFGDENLDYSEQTRFNLAQKRGNLKNLAEEPKHDVPRVDCDPEITPLESPCDKLDLSPKKAGLNMVQDGKLSSGRPFAEVMCETEYGAENGGREKKDLIPVNSKLNNTQALSCWTWNTELKSSNEEKATQEQSLETKLLASTSAEKRFEDKDTELQTMREEKAVVKQSLEAKILALKAIEERFEAKCTELVAIEQEMSISKGTTEKLRIQTENHRITLNTTKQELDEIRSRHSDLKSLFRTTQNDSSNKLRVMNGELERLREEKTAAKRLLEAKIVELEVHLDLSDLLSI
ncbi:hypothetical protein LENED_004304 [Lentinula edodes]|uniref:Uncharacterized protein n=1 Tax=Lentinula edodes TaxID=5353 RepID=A0A1Q3E5Y9_LENED|nr:hypothetical protein LENED_004304 [Lentinula edodes]